MLTGGDAGCAEGRWLFCHRDRYCTTPHIFTTMTFNTSAFLKHNKKNRSLGCVLQNKMSQDATKCSVYDSTTSVTRLSRSPGHIYISSEGWDCWYALMNRDHSLLEFDWNTSLGLTVESCVLELTASFEIREVCQSSQCLHTVLFYFIKYSQYQSWIKTYRGCNAVRCYLILG